MSMISAQIDGLRERAKELRSLAPDPDVPYLVPSTKETMALAMRSAASEMEDAADTIWQLRDDLQRAHDAVRDAEHDESRAWDRVRKAEAEADRLREERDMYRDLVDHMVHPDIPDQLAAENAKLRELVRTIYMCSCIQCDRCDYGHGNSCAFDAESELRELRVEVDG